MCDQCSTPEIFKRVQEYIAEHGYTTGQELLDITGNDFVLQHAYAKYWTGIIIPDTLEEIQRRIDDLS